jgi:hypothetical protein
MRSDPMSAEKPAGRDAHETGLPLAAAATARFFLARQHWHLLALLVLIPIAWAFAAPVLGEDAWLGIADEAWFWLGVSAAILHQVLVWLAWRGQLGWKLLSRFFGARDLAIWAGLFMPLLLARPLLLLGLALADRNSLALSRPIALGLGVALLLPSLYTFWSVMRHFGLPRAVGGDHFRTRFREMPLVREGAFRWSGHAMYAFGFLGLWSIALLAGSQAALSLALFQHAYIWVHYHCTEKPDMELLYGARP